MRLIDADNAVKKLREYRDSFDVTSSKYKIASALISILTNPQQTPTIEAEPVRTGRWIMTVYTTKSKRNRIISNAKFNCSECGYGNGRKQSNYCPNCGVKMEEQHGNKAYAKN